MNFEMPETQEEIPAALSAIQGMCSRPDKRTHRGYDDSTTTCQICKKERV